MANDNEAPLIGGRRVEIGPSGYIIDSPEGLLFIPAAAVEDLIDKGILHRTEPTEPMNIYSVRAGTWNESNNGTGVPVQEWPAMDALPVYTEDSDSSIPLATYGDPDLGCLFFRSAALVGEHHPPIYLQAALSIESGWSHIVIRRQKDREVVQAEDISEPIMQEKLLSWEKKVRATLRRSHSRLNYSAGLHLKRLEGQLFSISSTTLQWVHKLEGVDNLRIHLTMDLRKEIGEDGEPSYVYIPSTIRSCEVRVVLPQGESGITLSGVKRNVAAPYQVEEVIEETIREGEERLSKLRESLNQLKKQFSS